MNIFSALFDLVAGVFLTAKLATEEREQQGPEGRASDKGLDENGYEAHYQAYRNFTVVLDMKALAAELKKAKIDPAKHFAGKRVRVRGTMSLFDDRPQIMVKELTQVRVVEK